MVTKCLYCGQPLAGDNAHVCHKCGRLQIPEPAQTAAPDVIKVRLPPKEFVRREPPPALDQRRLERTPGPSRLVQRPVRLTAREEPPAREDALAEEATSAVFPPRADESAGPPVDQPVEEISTMVLPGWREELAHLRQQQARPGSPLPSEEAGPPPVLPAAPVSRHSEDTALPPPAAEKDVQAPSAPVEQGQDHRGAPAPLSEAARRELRLRIWEQEPTRRYPHVQAHGPGEHEAGPAPAVEHPPFAATFGEEGEVEPLAGRTAIDWQALARPGAAHAPEAERAENLPLESEEAEEEGGVEDLPTVPLAVPEVVKPAIVIERASTPAPASQEPEIEDLPTRPMPASQVAPRSPLPPLPPQSPPGREQRPVSYRAEASAAVPPPYPSRTPALYGPLPNPQSHPGQAFSPPPPSAPQGPLSSPGNAPLQRSPAQAPALATDEARKRRVSPLQVALLVVLVIVVGVGVSVFSYQATSGGAIAQPYQAFQNSTLGVSLSYPQGWTFSLNRAQTSVRFADSSHTGQVMLSMTAPDAASMTQYLDRQMTQLGIAVPQQAPTRLFGGESWQQVQGDVVQQGVTYMLELYATRHGTHIYTLLFLAPPPVYGRMEQESFAPLRASLRFI